MVAKDGTSKYLAGRRSDCWLKVKAYLRQEAVIQDELGARDPQSNRGCSSDREWLQSDRGSQLHR
jgi:hypothetical protein